MKGKQLLIWSINELDIFAPRKKTKKQLKQEQREEFNKSLITKIDLAPEFEKMRKPLNLKLLISLGGNHYSNKKVPKTLFTSLSQYHNKEKEDLDFVDLFQMYSSIESIFDGKVGYKELRKWRKANGLSFFGISQYDLMKKYVENIMNED